MRKSAFLECFKRPIHLYNHSTTQIRYISWEKRSFQLNCPSLLCLSHRPSQGSNHLPIRHISNATTTSPNDIRYNHVKTALLEYKAVYNNVIVPKNFVVPIDDQRFSKAVRGMKLGNVVESIRNKNYYNQHREELVAIGFEYTKQAGDFDLLREAFLSFKNIHGHLLVPAEFEVPVNDSQYPEAVWGIKLGSIVAQIRSHDIYKEHKDELLSMGFDYRKQIGDFPLLFQSLLIYKEKHGHLNIPASYVVSSTDTDYPERMRGKPLGQKLRRIRNMDECRKYRKELLSIGITYSFEPKPFPLFKTALMAYKTVYGDFFVPHKYIIPDNDLRFPSEVHGLRLGKYVDCLRTGHIYQDDLFIQELTKVGFFEEFKKGDFQTWKVALTTYKAIHGNLSVPQQFIIPIDDERYPPQIRGKRLGDAVHKIRNKNYYREYKDELMDIGFDFSSQIKQKVVDV